MDASRTLTFGEFALDLTSESLDARFSKGKAFVAMADVLDYAF